MKYTKDLMSLILYPLKSKSLSSGQKQLLNEFFEDIEEDDIIEVLSKEISYDEIEKFSKKMEDKDKSVCFNISKKLLEKSNVMIDNVGALAEIGILLGIDAEHTGFDFDIYDPEELKEYNFQITLNNFSIIASAIGFIPFIPVADFFILAPIQVGMVSKISNIYGFKINPKEFLKLISGTIGIGLVFKFTASILNRLIPFIGWIVNASIAFAGTYAIGIIARRYIESNGELTKESIREIWIKSYEDGKVEFQKLRKYIILKKDDLMIEIGKYFSKENIKEKENECNDDQENEPKQKTIKIK